MWTGDNEAKWSHLEASVPMLLSHGVAGITFIGADVGGFFGDPDAELMTRWYQVGALQPFFRGHAHIDAKRREPWLFGEPYTSAIRTAIRLRYRLLPYIYTTFFEAHVTGAPVMRPLWAEFPNQPEFFATQDMFVLGSALLVAPVTAAQTWSRSVTFPQAHGKWIAVETGEDYLSGSTVTVAAPLEKIPVFQRPGSVVARKERARRSSALMVNDPYTLVLNLDENGQAQGTLFLDDGVTFNYQNGNCALRLFTFTDGILYSSAHPDSGCKDVAYQTTEWIERIVVFGLNKDSATLTQGTVSKKLTTSNHHSYSKATGIVTVIRKPDVNIAEDFALHF